MSEEPRRAELFQLDRATCLALLATQPVGRLVTGTTDSPVVVVNYVVHDGAIVFRSDTSARVAAIVDSTVAFEADTYDARTRSGWSVVVRGTARDITWSTDGEPPPEVDAWTPGPKNRWLRITVEEITGRLLRGEVPASWVNSDAYL